ncbi:hypothetical protein MYX04_11180, partial [Nitrospiraceae bacterium AH_259_D15_M11_P09]|nr:hypothetical protein [Nitrospiraceae bacterium AH_259_D15_M11_P09]
TQKKQQPFLNKKPHATTKPDNKSAGQQAAVFGGMVFVSLVLVPALRQIDNAALHGLTILF